MRHAAEFFRCNEREPFAALARVQEFAEETNNTAIVPLPITLTPPPDLQVTEIEAPTHIMAGQPFDVSYTVANLGPGDASYRTAGMTSIYLSRDPYLDVRADPIVGSRQHQDSSRTHQAPAR